MNEHRVTEGEQSPGSIHHELSAERRFGTIGNSVGETPGRVHIARFCCGRLAGL
jgi:hypothetical protein